MKTITLYIENVFRSTTTAADLRVQNPIQSPIGEMYLLAEFNLADNSEELKEARNNAAQVIWATITIEGKIDEIIYKFLFKESDEKCNFFRNEILNSNSITFAFKKNLLIKILNISHLVKGEEKTNLDKYLKAIMDYRNSFAHGDLIWYAKKGVTLNYYQNGNLQKILNDDYWENLEFEYNSANKLLDSVRTAIDKVTLNKL